MPCACAFLAIAPSLPCDEWFRYQIHMPLPARGLLPAVLTLVWDEAPPVSGPAARRTRAAPAISARVCLRRRARMDSRLRTPEHASARKAAWSGLLSRRRGGQLLVLVVRGAHQP